MTAASNRSFETLGEVLAGVRGAGSGEGASYLLTSPRFMTNVNPVSGTRYSWKNSLSLGAWRLKRGLEGNTAAEDCKMWLTMAQLRSLTNAGEPAVGPSRNKKRKRDSKVVGKERNSVKKGAQSVTVRFYKVVQDGPPADMEWVSASASVFNLTDCTGPDVDRLLAEQAAKKERDRALLPFGPSATQVLSDLSGLSVGPGYSHIAAVRMLHAKMLAALPAHEPVKIRLIAALMATNMAVEFVLEETPEATHGHVRDERQMWLKSVKGLPKWFVRCVGWGWQPVDGVQGKISKSQYSRKLVPAVKMAGDLVHTVAGDFNANALYQRAHFVQCLATAFPDTLCLSGPSKRSAVSHSDIFLPMVRRRWPLLRL